MRRYLKLLNLIGITVALFFAVKIFYLWTTKDLYVLPSPAENGEETADPVNAPPPLSAYRSIQERNLFKTPPKTLTGSPGAGAMPAGASSLVPLNLKLWGTATFGEERGFAVIEDVQVRRQDLFAAGEKVQNATLKSIFRDRVVLSIDGKDLTLKLEDPRSLPERPVPIPAAVPQKASTQIPLSRTQIDDAIQNINELMTQIKIRPHFLDGKPDGLALGQISPDSIFSRMGLQNGDIITGVNGEKILTVDDALKLYQGIKSGSRVNVELKRAGKTESLVYQID